MAKSTKKADKFKRRRSLLAIVFAVIVVFAGVSIIGDMRAIAAQQRELEQLNRQIEQQQAANDELSRIIESGTEEERLERVAREKLGYVDPNERVYIDSVS